MSTQFFFTSTASGTPIRAFSVKQVETPKPTAAKAPAHLITIIDRSGSMYGVMAETREMVAKVLTVAEYQHEDLKVTVISYSSQGDCTVHAARMPIAEFMKPGSEPLAQIRNMQATYLTCASQALQEACKHIDKNELTGIVLHTDGWFNDRSPTEERKTIDHIIQHALWGNPNVFVNTVGYGYADRAMLDSIANRMSGRFVTASTVKEVYNAIFDTTKVLVGRTLPALPVETDGAAWVAAHNMGQKKVNGSTTDFTLRGVEENDPVSIYRFTEVSLDRAQKEISGGAIYSHRGALILARIALAQGDLRTSKGALLGSKYAPLLAQGHHRALSVTALGAYATALDEVLAIQDLGAWMAPLGLGQSDALPFTDLVAALNDEAKNLEISIHDLLGPTAAPYKRRGIKRVQGEWVETDGVKTFTPSKRRLSARWEDAAGFVPYSTISFSGSTASANLLVSVPADVVDNATDEVIRRVAGIKLDLRQHRNYTLISDGEVNLPVLPLHVTNKAAFGRLQAKGVLPETAVFTPGVVQYIALTDRPLVNDSADTDIQTLLRIRELFTLNTRISIRKGWEAGLSPEVVESPLFYLTPEQVEALAAVDVTPKLNFSPKTTVPYLNQAEAVAKGELDSYTRYEVTFGLVNVAVSWDELHSGNELLARFYQKVGDPKAKITWADVSSGQAKIEPKELSSRTKITAVDVFQRAILEEEIEWLVKQGKDTELGSLQARREEILAALRPLVFEIGSTGVAPSLFGNFLTGDAFTQKHTECKVPKKVKEEGIFYTNGEVVLTIAPRIEWYTTPKGEEAAKALTQFAAID